MDSFFGRYPAFDYKPQEPPIFEFMRLRASTPSWNKLPASSYLEARESFLLTWKRENSTVPVDTTWEFFSQFPEIVYDPREEGFNPITEFERLAVLRKWNVAGKRYQRIKGELQQALGMKTGASGPRSLSHGVILGHTGISSQLSVFFSKFTDFDYDSTKLDVVPISEFERLAAFKKWRRLGKKYVKNRKEFDMILEMAQQEGSSPKHIPPFKDPVGVFFSQFPDFHYDLTKDGATPRSEFERMAELKGWILGGKDYRLREKQLQEAEGFVKRGCGNDPMGFFFAPWPTFTYTSTVDARTANLEFNRLSKAIGFCQRTERKRRTEFENALRFLYEDDGMQQGDGLKNLSETVNSIERDLGAVKLSQEGAAGFRSIANPGPASFTPSNGRGPLDKFFATYPDFSYNPAAPCKSEFKRLCTLRGWKPDSKGHFRTARMAFARATGEELLSHLERNGTVLSVRSGLGQAGYDYDDEEGTGTQDDSLPWRRMCRILNLRKGDGLRPKSKTQCKKVLNGTFFNIFDFVDYLHHQTELKRFQSLKALAEYSYDEDKVYPKAAAKGNELFRFLLHRISSA